jgi:glycosyltransferase involved in cell wall biosynthesis
MAESGTPRRVLLVLDHFHPHVGGGETLFLELARGLAGRGDDVSVVTLRRPRSAPREETIDRIAVRRVWAPPFAARIWFIVAALPAALSGAREADVVHAAGYAATLPAWIAARLLGKPFLVTVYEVLGEGWRDSSGRRSITALASQAFEAFLLRLGADAYVCISEYTKARLERLLGGRRARIAVVYPAVDHDFWTADRHRPRALRSELGLAESRRICVFFGRPGVSKGVETLIQAAEILHRGGDDRVHFVLLLSAQPSSPHERVRTAIRRRGLESILTLRPSVPREELPGYLMAADCVAVPSLSEGFGYSAVEAALLGCRVVSTAGHAVEEVLAGHATFVPPGDPYRLAEAVRAVATSDRRGDPPPRRFDRDTQVRGMSVLYDEALTSASGRK